MNKNVWLLACVQAMAMASGALMVLVSGIFGARVAPEATLATLPMALMILGTATMVAPATLLMRQFGRKNVFLGCSAAGIVGSGVAVVAINSASFWLFCGAAAVLGSAVAGFQQLRFAAIESVDVAKAPKAMSHILLGGLVAAILGPELSSWGLFLTPDSFAGSFYLLAILMVLSGVLLLFYQPMQQSVSEDQKAQSSRPLGEIFKQPQLVVAVAAASLGYALMAFIMTATPLHMHIHEGQSLADTKLVIQSHIIAMYLPSFFTGHLITRFGERVIIWAGIFSFAAVLTFASLAATWWFYWLALVLLGVGWNFLFSAGTSLLPKSHHQNEKFKVLAVNEVCVFGMQALASLSAGAVLFALGWQTMMMVCIPLLMVLVALLLWWRPTQQPNLREQFEG
ncbi:MAG: MFS transporter [Aestuariibacter sp.]